MKNDLTGYGAYENDVNKKYGDMAVEYFSKHGYSGDFYLDIPERAVANNSCAYKISLLELHDAYEVIVYFINSDKQEIEVVTPYIDKWDMSAEYSLADYLNSNIRLGIYLLWDDLIWGDDLMW